MWILTRKIAMAHRNSQNSIGFENPIIGRKVLMVKL